MIRFASFCYGLRFGVDSKIRVRISAFAERLSGPLGNVPLDRAVRADLGLFQILRESGATWPQIANALATAGARRADGTIISADHVRSAVTRQLKRTPPVEDQQSRPSPPDRHQPPRAQQKHAIVSSNREHHLSDEISAPTDDQSAKSDSRAAAAGLPDEQRSLSIREKLERTRKLRES